MKRSVYITGISCTILMLFGCIAKIMHWPGASVLLIISVFLFCFFFLPAALMNNYNNLPVKKMGTLHVVGFLVFGVSMMGALFKIMHWPGAAVFLLLGLLSPFVVFLPVYLYSTKDEEKTGNKNFLALVLGLTFLAVFSVFLAMSVSRQILLQGAAAVNNNEAEIKFIGGGSQKTKVSTVANDLFAYADELKCTLLSSTGENMCNGNTTNENYNAENILIMDGRETVKTFSTEEGALKIKTLKEKIEAFREAVLSSGISPELAELTKTLFDTSDTDLTGGITPGEWQRKEIDNYPMIFTLDFLSKLQSNVRLIESETLN